MFITPAVAGERVFIGSCAGSFLALDRATGEIAWSYDTSQDGSSAQFHGDALVTEELVVVGSDALDAATGRHLWRRDLGATLNTSAALAGGELVVGSQDGRLHRLSPKTGEVLGSASVPGMSYGDLTEAGGCLLALSAEGELDESMEPGGPYHLTCLDPGLAEVRWRHTSDREISTFRPLVHEGLVIAGGRSLLFALDLADGSLAWQHPVEGVPRGLGAAGGTLYVGTLSGKVLALPMAPGTPASPGGDGSR